VRSSVKVIACHAVLPRSWKEVRRNTPVLASVSQWHHSLLHEHPPFSSVRARLRPGRRGHTLARDGPLYTGRSPIANGSRARGREETSEQSIVKGLALSCAVQHVSRCIPPLVTSGDTRRNCLYAISESPPTNRARYRQTQVRLLGEARKTRACAEVRMNSLKQLKHSPSLAAFKNVPLAIVTGSKTLRAPKKDRGLKAHPAAICEPGPR
jgi:hypothetical protein